MWLRINKDIKLRKKLLATEFDKKQLKFVFIRTLNYKGIARDEKKIIVNYFTSKNKNYSTKTKIVNRCLETSKARVMHKSFKISRMKLKNMLDMGIIPGYKKAAW
jgi:ribosomal protein S14